MFSCLKIWKIAARSTTGESLVHCFSYCMQHDIGMPIEQTSILTGGIRPNVWDRRPTLGPTNTTLTTARASVSKTALEVIAEGSSEEYGMNSTTTSLRAVPRNSGG